MKINTYLLALALVFPSITYANTVGIGTDPVTTENYSCVPGKTKKKSKIQVANSASGAMRLLSKKRAVAKNKRSLKQTIKRRKSVQKGLRKANKTLQRLLSKLIITNEVVAQTEATKLKVENLTLRVAELDSQVATLRELKKAIKRCGGNSGLNGNFTLVAGSFSASNNKIFFYSYYLYVIDNWDEQFSRICVFDNRSGRRVAVVPFSPKRCIAQDPVRGVDTCYANADDIFDGRWYVYVDGRSGYQDPGTCDPNPWMCSFSEAQGELDGAINGLSYTFVGFLRSGQDCDDLA